ncbi:hypothetical protein, partial [Vitiosangium sp. GDMCC 1.1324]|uniref:hypothetical protein n=1 Tax=Vitiosangium sp. (strain GDMCC 1.1324) TaxID=2138576 RepID=UPI000D386BFA
EALLAPFLSCTSPGEVLALQERVDMPRLVEALDDWRAVRLGALGPPREDIARQLNEKRTSLLVNAPEAYGRLNAQVLAVFTVDSAYDDDLREILFLLAQDKRLAETLALLPAFQVALEKRGLKPTARVDRDSELGDMGWGVVRAGKDVLSSTSMARDGQDSAFLTIRLQLPPEYQEALATAEKELVLNASANSMAVSAFDELTFGVPLGSYGFVATTLHGGKLLWQGELEEGTREVAPALVLGLIAGGKGLRNLAKGEGAAGVRLRIISGVEAAEARLRALTETARQFKGAMSLEGLRELVREVRASREAGRFVAVGGADAALALHEAGGDVARARPLMSRAKPGATGSSPVKAGAGAGAGEAAAVTDEAARPSATKAGAAELQGTLASLVDKEIGLTLDVVEAKLAAAELEATGPRLPADVGVLEKYRPSLDAPPPEVRGNPRWREYVDYYNRRFIEVEKGTAAEGPLKWEPYERMRAWFARGMAFERDTVKLLKADAEKPRSQRTFLGDFDKPRIETQVGVRKPGPGLRYADVLVIEEGELGGQPRRVETFSFKSRDLSGLKYEALEAQMKMDAREALRNYGGTLDIRRPGLEGPVEVQRVRLIYEGGKLTPTDVGASKAAASATEKAVPGVEVLFQ